MRLVKILPPEALCLSRLAPSARGEVKVLRGSALLDRGLGRKLPMGL